jgi:BlaI family transcriptional regulator, penicillinase repressor
MGKPPMHRFMDLGRRERQILEALFRRGRSSAREVLAELPDPPSYSAVRAMLAKLEAKQLVTSESEGRIRVYRAAALPDTARRGALRRIVDGLYDGSTERTVAALISAKRPDAAELDRLAALIERAKRGGR